VNGVNTTPSPCVFSSGGFPCSVAVPVGAGINEVSFTNAISCNGTPTNPCTGPPPPDGSASPNLGIVNYSLVSQVAATDTRSYMTYRANLLNSGAKTLGPVMAMLSSLDPSSVQVVGRSELNFASAPPFGQVASSNTFTILTDPTVPLDFSKLSWTYYSRRSVPPER
jgi:hypothetical protein